jgi:hypothetical protein
MWWGLWNEGGRRCGRSRHVDTTFGAALCSGSLRRLNGCPFVSLVSDSITHGRCKVIVSVAQEHRLAWPGLALGVVHLRYEGATHGRS